MKSCLTGKPCNLCCKLLAIGTLRKPRYQWCQHCNKGGGCSIYQERPEECGTYTCLWLQSQVEGHPLPDGLKPSRCGVVIDASSTNTHNLVLHVNDGADWRKGEIGKFIKAISEMHTLLIREKDRLTVVRNNKIAGSEVCFTGEEFGEAQYEVTPIPLHSRKVAVP